MKTLLTLLAAAGLAGAALSAPLTEKEQAAIRQEVTAVMQDYTVACERVDFAGALKFAAESPEFRYADTDGKLYDYPAFKKLLGEIFAPFTAQKAFTQRQEITVLGPDAALVAWHGALELTQKDGAVLRSDPYNVTCVFKRLGGAWKIVYQHESGLPPQPVASASAGAAIAPLKDLGDLLVGRWLADITWAVDYPGLGKKGDKVVGYELWKWSADSKALECDWLLGATTGKSFMWWDAATKQIRSLDVDSGGGGAQGTITRQGAKWVSMSAGSLADGHHVDYQSEITFPDNGQSRINAGATILNGVRNEYRDVFKRVGR